MFWPMVSADLIVTVRLPPARSDTKIACGAWRDEKVVIASGACLGA